MTKGTLVVLAVLALLAHPERGRASTYFPYESIDSYFNQPPHSPTEPAPGQAAPSQPPPAEPPAEPTLQAPLRAMVITQAPEFLFPPKLGFGVAVGVPYDMAYIAGTYYHWRAGVWYRSSSYNGPWTIREYSQLPPELQKHKLAEIRAAKNREFAKFWKDKEHYPGKRFRPHTGGKEHPGRKPGQGPASP